MIKNIGFMQLHKHEKRSQKQGFSNFHKVNNSTVFLRVFHENNSTMPCSQTAFILFNAKVNNINEQ